ncbi:hypothetical protein Asera_13430 [Actinocatenispora sera]|uniref:Uncharacterized protein n=1 Tax=Actinocatenispora sera TaxID=390989 RepID=A0A810KX30_9ACTN|nr:hypothetical protein Asera_13430 [Actinocatenispora sera]
MSSPASAKARGPPFVTCTYSTGAVAAANASSSSHGASRARSSRSTTPYRVSAAPTRNSPGISEKNPVPTSSPAASTGTASAAVSQRGANDSGSSTASPTTA